MIYVLRNEYYSYVKRGYNVYNLCQTRLFDVLIRCNFAARNTVILIATEFKTTLRIF